MLNDETRRTAGRIAREHYGRLVAFLAARTRDIAGAEDALADAFTAALQHWPVKGVPANPDAWLLTVARRRRIDALRREQTRVAGVDRLQRMADELIHASATPDEIPDRRLALMFACAHPAIEPGMRAPLILQTVLGLTAVDIAAAFLIPPATMGQRLVRAKARIRDAGIPFGLPERDEMPERLHAVLDAVYAAYTKSWAEIGETGSTELAEEAIWLGRLIVSLLPDEPEASGLLALMLYTEARRAARRNAQGAFVPLADQDSSLWVLEQIDEAEALLKQASAGGPSGRYQIEAAIQSAHIAGCLLGRDNRSVIVALYDHLRAMVDSPVVVLNRAVAIAEVEGTERALAELEVLASDKRMDSYQPFWAVRAHFYARLNRVEEAQEAYTVAIGLSADPAVKAYLQLRRDALQRPDCSQ